MDLATWALCGVTALAALVLPGTMGLMRLWADVEALKVASTELLGIREMLQEIRERVIRIETRQEGM